MPVSTAFPGYWDLLTLPCARLGQDPAELLERQGCASVALAFGLRPGDATGLRWDDLDLDTGEIRVRPRNVLRMPHDLLKASGLPRIRLAAGVQLAEVSKVLGHFEVRSTSDVHAHLQHETAARAAAQMDALFPAACKNGRSGG